MEENGIVKSGNDVYMTRISQVRRLNINLPYEDKASLVFHDCLFGGFTENSDGKHIVRNILIGDAYNALLNCLDICRKKKYDDKVMTLIWSVFTTFKNMTVVDFTFLENSSLVSDCMNILDEDFKGNKSELFEKVYDVKEMEIYLSDSLNEDAMDFINRMFIFFEYLPNDYMKRRFRINFEFDEYVNFISMLFSNNKDLAKRLGDETVNHLVVFPSVAERSKPVLRIVTNYKDL